MNSISLVIVLQLLYFWFSINQLKVILRNDRSTPNVCCIIFNETFVCIGGIRNPFIQQNYITQTQHAHHTYVCEIQFLIQFFHHFRFTIEQ